MKNKKWVVFKNYAYYILIRLIWRPLAVILFFPLFILLAPVMFITDGFESTYTEGVQNGEIDLWKRDDK